MISFDAVIAVAFLVLFGYMISLLKKSIDIYEHKNYSDFKAYQETVQKTGSRAFKPMRLADQVGIHRIKGDRTKLTTKDPSGIAHTQDAEIPIYDADPEAVMSAVDRSLGYTVVKDNS